MTAVLAEAYVRIRPRSTGFKQEADADLRREKPSDVAVQVSADTRTADERLRLLKDRLDTLRMRVTDARVRLDGDDRALGRLAEIDAAMIRLDRARANPKIDLEGVARAEGQIAGLNAQLTRLDHRGGGGAGGSGGGILQRLAGAGSGGVFGGLGLAAVGGGAAAVPLGIGAAGLGASFLTPATAGTTGLGLFGAASISAFHRVGTAEDQITALNKRIANTPATKPAGTPAQISAAQARLTAAQKRLALAQASDTSTPASVASAQASVASAQSSLQSAQGGGPNAEHDKLIKQRKQILDQLTPAEKKAADGIKQLEETWKHFQRAVEPESFKLLATGTDIFRKGLTDLLPMTKAVGDTVDNLAARADKALDAPFWQHFFGEFLTREAPRAVDALGTSLGNVLEGLARLSERWHPLGHDLEDSMVSLSDRFEAWTRGQGPGAFLDWVERDGPVAADALKGIANAIIAVGRGFEPIGRVELQALTPILNFIGTLGEQHPEVLTAVGVAYLGIAGGLKAIAAINGLAGVAATVRGVGRGGGGKLGGFAGSLSAPVPVYVTNWGGGPGGMPGPGGGKEPTPGGKKTLPLELIGPLTLAYAATQGGDSAPFNPKVQQSNAGAAGSALETLIRSYVTRAAGEGRSIPTSESDAASKAIFSGSVDDPHGLKVNVPEAVKFIKTYGDPAAIATLDQLGRKYGDVKQALNDYAKQQDVLNKLLLVNPGLAKNAAAANDLLAASLRRLSRAYSAPVEHSLRQSQTTKLDRLNALTDDRGAVTPPAHHRSVSGESRGGGSVVYDLRGSTFQHVNHPHELERQLKSKQRLAGLGTRFGA